MNKIKQPAWMGALVSAVVLTVGLVACSSTDPSGDGTLRLSLVDAPAPIAGIERIDITFSQVLVHKTSSAELDDAQWIVLLDDQVSEAERTFNLLDYVNGAAAVLGTAELGSGHYSQIRIIIDSATITVDGVESDLTILSGTVSGLKLTHAFNIDEDVITEIVLDFDAGESVSEVPPGSGEYRLQPTIRVVTEVVSGTISGNVTPIGIDAMVIAYEVGTTTVVTSTYVDPATGDYVLPALLAGTYDLEAVAEGYVTATESDVSVTAQTDSGDHDFVLGSGSGSLQLSIVDAPTPIEGVEKIDITFASILVHRTSSAELDDAEWIVLMDGSLTEAERTFDLLEYVNGASGVLGAADLESGHYSQIRVIIESAAITIDGTESPLTINSGTVSGLKLTHAFTIEEGVLTEIILDFDAGESVSEVPAGSGQYRLQPTIRTVTKALSGTISGSVAPTGINAMVIAYVTGTTTVVTSTYVDTLSGDYVLPALLEGTYDLEAVAEGYVTATESGVMVTPGMDSGDHDFVLAVSGGGEN